MAQHLRFSMGPCIRGRGILHYVLVVKIVKFEQFQIFTLLLQRRHDDHKCEDKTCDHLAYSTV